MATLNDYSKRYSQQGSPIKPVDGSDKFLISRAVEPLAPYSLGYRTYLTSNDQMCDFTVKTLKTNIDGLFAFGKGIGGTGSVLDPIHVDHDWVSQRYTETGDWPFTQVGDPSDNFLPVVGSYLSVCYPSLTDCPGFITSYVEGNGDLRMLRHVTNGEQIAVVYSVWKNYKNTSPLTIVHTDHVYRPPGLASDEFIFHVFSASDTAMVVEIHSYTTGFREYGFIVLNGTLHAEAHRLIRMSKAPITGVIGTNLDVPTWVKYNRLCNMAAVIVKDVNYLVLTAPPGVTVSANTSNVRLFIATVSDTGVITRVGDWTATNSEGLVTSNPYMAVLNPELVTYDPTNIGALFYSNKPQDQVWLENGPTSGVCAHNRIMVGGVKPNGYITLVMNHYAIMNTRQGARDLKPCFYYDIDIEGKRVIPSTDATSRRWEVSCTDTGEAVVVKKSTTYQEGHQLTKGILVGILNNGERMVQVVPGADDVAQQITVYRGDVTSLNMAGSDVNFANPRAYTNIVYVEPPTPVKSKYQATILHNKMRVVESTGLIGSDYHTGKSLALLNGSYTDRSYSLLTSNPFNTQRSIYTGYQLNNQRVKLGDQSAAIYAFRKNGSIYYHNATWSSFDAVSLINYWGIDANSVGSYQFKLSQAVATKLTNLMKVFPKQGGYVEYGSSYWAITPFYPNIGEPYALVRFIQSYKTVDSSALDGWSRSNCYQQFFIFPATIIVDSLNIATLSDIDTTGFNPDLRQISVGNILEPAQADAYGNMAFDITGTGYEVMYRGGCPDRVTTSGRLDAQTVTLNYLKFDSGRQLVSSVWSPAGVSYNAIPAMSPIYGLGVVRTEGLGAFYLYSKYLPDTNLLDLANGSYVLGTARPAESFAVTISSPFTVYVEGRLYTVPTKTIDLTAITPSYTNAHFYCYVIIRDGVATFKVDTRRLDESLYRIYVGYIKTSATEVIEINCRPVTRWEVGRASQTPIGNGFPVSTGLPSDVNVTVWENATTIPGPMSEYMWGSDDIIDSDVGYIISDLYWAYDQMGTQPLTAWPTFNESIFLIVKTIGISESVDITFESSGFQPNDFQIGTMLGTINIPLIFNSETNVGFGYYNIQTWEIDVMAFNNATPLDVTTQRAFNTEYTNDLDFAIQVTVTVDLDEISTMTPTSLIVNGVPVASTRFNITGGSGVITLPLTALVPAGGIYQVVQGSGARLYSWVEFGRV